MVRYICELNNKPFSKHGLGLVVNSTCYRVFEHMLAACSTHMLVHMIDLHVNKTIQDCIVGLYANYNTNAASSLRLTIILYNIIVLTKML